MSVIWYIFFTFIEMLFVLQTVGSSLGARNDRVSCFCVLETAQIDEHLQDEILFQVKRSAHGFNDTLIFSYTIIFSTGEISHWSSSPLAKKFKSGIGCSYFNGTEMTSFSKILRADLRCDQDCSISLIQDASFESQRDCMLKKFIALHLRGKFSGSKTHKRSLESSLNIEKGNLGKNFNQLRNSSKGEDSSVQVTPGNPTESKIDESCLCFFQRGKWSGKFIHDCIKIHLRVVGDVVVVAAENSCNGRQVDHMTIVAIGKEDLPFGRMSRPKPNEEKFCGNFKMMNSAYYRPKYPHSPKCTKYESFFYSKTLWYIETIKPQAGLVAEKIPEGSFICFIWHPPVQTLDIEFREQEYQFVLHGSGKNLRTKSRSPLFQYNEGELYSSTLIEGKKRMMELGYLYAILKNPKCPIELSPLTEIESLQCYFLHSFYHKANNKKIVDCAKIELVLVPESENIEFAVKVSHECGGTLYEVAIMALTDNGFPIGAFKTDTSIYMRSLCSPFSMISNTTLVYEIKKCLTPDQNSPIQGLQYLGHGEESTQIYVKNSWRDDINSFCLKWQLESSNLDVSYSSKPFKMQFMLKGRTIKVNQDSPDSLPTNEQKFASYSKMFTFKYERSKAKLNSSKSPSLRVTKSYNKLQLHQGYVKLYNNYSEKMVLPPLYPAYRNYSTCLKIHPSVPRLEYVQTIGKEMYEYLKDCFLVEAIPLTRSNWIHLKIRHYPRLESNRLCKYLKPNFYVIAALNNKGFPVGSGFSLYTSNLSSSNEEYCLNEDLFRSDCVTLKEHRCNFLPPDPSLALQSSFKLGDMATVLVVHNANELDSLHGGACFTWKYSTDLKSVPQTPSHIQFVVEFFLESDPMRPSLLNQKPFFYVKRSKKIRFNYVAKPVKVPPGECHQLPKNSKNVIVEYPSIPEPSYYDLVLSKELYRYCEKQGYHPPSCFRPVDTRTLSKCEKPPLPVTISPDPVQVETLSLTDIDLPKIYIPCGVMKRCYVLGNHKCIINFDCSILFSFTSFSKNEVVVELLAPSQQENIEGISLNISQDANFKNGIRVTCTKQMRSALLEHWSISNRHVLSQMDNSMFKLIQLFSSSAALYCKLLMKKELKAEVENLKINFNMSFFNRKYFTKVESQGIDRGVLYPINVLLTGPQNLSEIHKPPGGFKAHLRQHGVFHIVAFIFLVPVGNFVARYGKTSIISSLMAPPLWIMCHVAFETLAVFLISFSEFLYAEDLEWTLLPKTNHFKTGYSCILSVVATFLTGGFIMLKKFNYFSKRSYQGYFVTLTIIHAVLGHITNALGAASFITAADITFSVTNCDYLGFIRLWLIILILSNYFMTYQEVWIPFFNHSDETNSLEFDRPNPTFLGLSLEGVTQRYDESHLETLLVQRRIYIRRNIIVIFSMFCFAMVLPLSASFGGQRCKYAVSGFSFEQN